MPAKKENRNLAMLKKTLKDEEAMKEIDEVGKGLLFYNKQSPTQKRRTENAKEYFETYCAVILDNDNPTAAEMWNKDTIIERTEKTILIMAKNAKGSISEKPKVGVLYQYKEALYFWMIRHIDDVSSIILRWHNVALAAIHKGSIEFGFNTSSREKNRLTDVELRLFWYQIQKLSSGRDNWKQHYILWLFVYYTSVRPGSLTICYGYEKGTLIAGSSKRRPEDETLRWSDISFFRDEECGIGFKINFKFIKGYRDASVNKILPGQRTFTIFPLNSSQYHMDLALLVTGLAFSRGLFSEHATIDSLWNGDEKSPKVNAEVAKQAVFIAAGQDENLHPDKAMRESAINVKLQAMCAAVGLLARNTIYAFRRTAIVETRRKHGTERATEMAGQRGGSSAIYAYDDANLEDEDLANDRLNLKKKDRAAVRAMFSQANIARVSQSSATAESTTSTRDALKNETKDRAANDPAYVNAIEDIRMLKADIEQHLFSLGIQEHEVLRDQDIKAQLRTHTDDAKCAELLKEWEDKQRETNNLYRRLVNKYEAEVKSEMLKHAKDYQKVAKKRGNSGPGGAAGFQFSAEQQVLAQAESNKDPADDFADEMQQLAGEKDIVDDDEPETSTEEGRSNEQPAEWDNLPSGEVRIVAELAENEAPPTAAGRFQFLKDFLELKSEQTGNLTCLQCKLDDTMPYSKKAMTYTRTKLDRHLKQDHHSRSAQLLRAFMIDYPDRKGACPLCRDDGIEDEICTSANFIEHVKEYHFEQFAD